MIFKTNSIFLTTIKDGYRIPCGPAAIPDNTCWAITSALQPANTFLSLSGQANHTPTKEQHGVSLNTALNTSHFAYLLGHFQTFCFVVKWAHKLKCSLVKVNRTNEKIQLCNMHIAIYPSHLQVKLSCHWSHQFILGGFAHSSRPQWIVSSVD